MPKRLVQPMIDHVSRDIALQKTITYRIIVAIGGASIIGTSWLLTSNPLITVLGGSLASEVFRTGVYYAHERWWNGRTVQTKK